MDRCALFPVGAYADMQISTALTKSKSATVRLDTPPLANVHPDFKVQCHQAVVGGCVYVGLALAKHQTNNVQCALLTSNMQWRHTLNVAVVHRDVVGAVFYIIPNNVCLTTLHGTVQRGGAEAATEP